MFLDVSKTFGIVNHDILLTKLDHYGFLGFVNSWLSSYAVYDNQCSFLCTVIAVVPQDTILGSFFYILYINDICNVTNEAHCVLYADETVILVSGPNLNELWHENIYIFLDVIQGGFVLVSLR